MRHCFLHHRRQSTRLGRHSLSTAANFFPSRRWLFCSQLVAEPGGLLEDEREDLPRGLRFAAGVYPPEIDEAPEEEEGREEREVLFRERAVLTVALHERPQVYGVAFASQMAEQRRGNLP